MFECLACWATKNDGNIADKLVGTQLINTLDILDLTVIFKRKLLCFGKSEKLCLVELFSENLYFT